MFVVWNNGKDWFFTTAKNWNRWNRDPEQVTRVHGVDNANDVKKTVAMLNNVDINNVAVINYLGNM